MKAIIVGTIFLLGLILIVPKVNAQPYFNVYPTQGNVNTDIFLQIRGLPGTGFYEVYYLYIFWDDTLLGTFPDNSQTYNHYFDTHFSPLNRDNYSALGNHTVYFEVWNAGRSAMFINASFVFTITEYIPCPEYLALNATYYELLSDCEALNASYNALQIEYNNLLANYTSLLADYNHLASDHNSLLSSHASLSNNYDSLSNNYDSLEESYNNLKTAFDSLKKSYDDLKASYESLEVNNSNLTANHDILVGEVGFTRNLGYLFAVTTMLFLATSVYFALRKRKTV